MSPQTVLLKNQKLVPFWRKACFSLSSNRFRMVEKCRMKAQSSPLPQASPGVNVSPEKSIARKGRKSERSAQPSLPENPRGRTIVGQRVALTTTNPRTVACILCFCRTFAIPCGARRLSPMGAAGKRHRLSNTLYII